MLRYIVAVFAPDQIQALEAGTKELSAAMVKSPYSGEAVAALATRLAGSMTPVVDKVRQVRIDTPGARRFVGLIVKDLPYLLESDIRSAEQAVMGVNTLVSDIARSNPALNKLS